MAVHFPAEEFSARIRNTVDALNDYSLDAVLLFAPESHYYLTGYDTFGFAMFQSMVVTSSGDCHLFTRLPDLRQAQQTSILSDAHIHIWEEYEGCNPHRQLWNLVQSVMDSPRRLGIEKKTVGLTAWNAEQLVGEKPENIELIEASNIVSELRRVKSATELRYHQRAAELSDEALDAAMECTCSGAFEGDILASMQGAVFKGGGSYAGNEFIVGSGPAALLCRYQSGPRHLDATDQLTLEWSGAYHRYHAAMMRTLLVGQVSRQQQKMHRVAVDALQACEEAMVPGRPMGEVFTAHAKVFDANGLQAARMQACGYGMGAVFNPIWVDFPMFYEGNPVLMQVGNVFFLHMILMDSDSGHAMCWGHSVALRQNGVQRLSRSGHELIVL